MEPLIKDGALCAFTKVEPPRAGDIVVIWWRPETVPEGELQASVKRLVMGPPPKLTFPHNDQPESTAIPTITVEMLNPKRYMRTLCSEVLALHKYVGEIPSERASWRRLGGGQ